MASLIKQLSKVSVNFGIVLNSFGGQDQISRDLEKSFRFTTLGTTTGVRGLAASSEAEPFALDVLELDISEADIV